MQTTAEKIEGLVKASPYCEAPANNLKNKLRGKIYAEDLTLYLLEEFIKKNISCADKIIQAVDILKEEPDAVPAIKKTARALSKNQINVFFSYKIKNEDAVSNIVKALRSASPQLFNIVYAKEFIVGDTYRDKICRAARNANWFILLLPEQSDDWDWCLYESGLFNATRFSSDKLICIHHGNVDIPDQINDFNAVAATTVDVNEFLEQIYYRPNALPGMGVINSDAPIDSIGKTIIEAIAPPSKITTTPVVNYIVLKVDDPKNIETDDGLKKSIILEFNPFTPRLFGRTGKINTWGDLVHKVLEKNEDHRWHTQIREAILAASNEDIPNPVCATFSGHSGKMYRPAVHAINVKPSGSVDSICITFSEDVTAVDTGHIPKDIRVLNTAMKLGFRFRWEILENKKFFNKQISENEIQELESALDRMENEATSIGIMDPNVLVSLFEKSEEKTMIKKMFTDWMLMRNKEGTGRLDLAIRNNNAQEIQKVLKGLSPMNKKFLKLASNRFSELFLK